MRAREHRHVVWDWNGTLLDDLAATLEAINEVMDHFGAAACDEDTYRRHYTRPVQRFYEHLLDRPLDDEDWHLIDADTPVAARGRSLTQASWFARDGRLVASVTLDAVMRVRDP